MTDFTPTQANQILNAMREKGFRILAGLTGPQITGIEKDCGFSFPPDLKIMLTNGVITDSEGNFPNWHESSSHIMEDAQNRIDNAFVFDIKNSNYWCKLFGPKPESPERSVKIATERLHEWPKLIPIYGHRYLPSEPKVAGNPIFSVWQATDTVYYGNDLLDYFVREFDLDLKVKSSESINHVPYWAEAFELT